MNQYFKVVNVSKQEVVCPKYLNGGAHFWAWAADPFRDVFTQLLRRSSEDAVSVILGNASETELGDMSGRWTGDELALIYRDDSSQLWEQAKSYRNISLELADVWNRFIPFSELKLAPREDCTCQQSND